MASGSSTDANLIITCMPTSSRRMAFDQFELRFQRLDDFIRYWDTKESPLRWEVFRSPVGPFNGFRPHANSTAHGQKESSQPFNNNEQLKTYKRMYQLKNNSFSTNYWKYMVKSKFLENSVWSINTYTNKCDQNVNN